MFPDPQGPQMDPDLNPEGIVAFGADLKPETVLTAYSKGIFPWPIEGLPLAWFCPPKRAILEFSELHIPRSLARARKKSPFRFTLDQSFAEVIEACSEVPRPGQSGTWITPPMIEAYIRLHEKGHAHSAEVWDVPAAGPPELVGGIYGVAALGAFAGESMFHRRPNASKLALLHLVAHLKDRGLDWIDIQMLTPHMQALGAKEISRAAFLKKLARTHARRLALFGAL